MIKILLIKILSFYFFINIYCSDESDIKKKSFADELVFVEVSNSDKSPVSIVVNHAKPFDIDSEKSTKLRHDDKHILSLSSNKPVIIGLHIAGGVLFRSRRYYRAFSSEMLSACKTLSTGKLTITNKTVVKSSSGKE